MIPNVLILLGGLLKVLNKVDDIRPSIIQTNTFFKLKSVSMIYIYINILTYDNN